MEKQIIDAVFENGAFRPLHPGPVPLAPGQRVRLTIEPDPSSRILESAARVYQGLSESEIDEIEQIALDRRDFFETEDSG